MKNRTTALSTWLLGAAFVFFWNSGFIGADYALPFAEPFTLLFWRYWSLALLLGGFLALRGRLRWPGRGPVGTAFLIGALAHGVWLGCVLFSLLHGAAPGIVALVVALQPMATGALSGRMAGEPTPLIRWVGLSVGFAGVLIAVAARTDFTDAGSIFAYSIPFGSVVAITIASLIQRRIDVGAGGPPMPVDLNLFYQALGTALAVTLPAVLWERLATDWNAEFVAAMLWLTVPVSLGAYAFMWLLIRRMDATRVASLFYLGPPVTMLMAWAALGDTLLWTDAAGLAVIAAGIVLVQIPGRGRGG
ncbi:MAG: DMT family transporter [Puniceicoccaceae bacterium]